MSLLLVSKASAKSVRKTSFTFFLLSKMCIKPFHYLNEKFFPKIAVAKGSLLHRIRFYEIYCCLGVWMVSQIN